MIKTHTENEVKKVENKVFDGTISGWWNNRLC